MREPKAKVTVLIDASIARDLRSAVGEGRASSQSALVQEAVTEYLAAQEREALRKAYGDAAKDPVFISDIDAIRRDFRAADADPELDIPS